jgi:hypothetical protein
MKIKLLHFWDYNAMQSVDDSNPTILFHTVVLSFVISSTSRWIQMVRSNMPTPSSGFRVKSSLSVYTYKMTWRHNPEDINLNNTAVRTCTTCFTLDKPAHLSVCMIQLQIRWTNFDEILHEVTPKFVPFSSLQYVGVRNSDVVTALLPSINMR